MKRPHRWAGSALVLTLLAGLLSGSASPMSAHPSPPLPRRELLPSVQSAIDDAAVAGGFVDLLLAVGTPAEGVELRHAVEAVGGTVQVEGPTTVRAHLPAKAARQIAQSATVQAAGVNQRLDLDEPRIAAVGQPIEIAPADQGETLNFSAIGVEAFRQAVGAQGRGVTIAFVDSGVDPGHPDLRSTVDGAPKIIDWKDFTGEGLVGTTATVTWGPTFGAPNGKVYKLPARPAVSQGARFGFWDEFNIQGALGRDLDQNGSQTDRFGVLFVDSQRTGQYDLVYVDTNNDGDFTDEEPLRRFGESQSVGYMGRIRVGPNALRRLSFAVADLDPAGGWVSFGFDGLGHGTQVAGVAAANNPGGMTGIAPGAQIMALKAVNSAGNGDWFAIRRAINYAAQNGAQIINVSIGGLAAAASRYDATAAEWLNQLSRQYGVLIVLAADNVGPGLSSGATLGNPTEVMAVGAYYSPAMWRRDFNWIVPEEGIWSLSGMGPRSDGSYLPNVVAPGGSPAPSPRWRHSTGYTTAAGTSVAVPHVTGSAALLMEAGRKSGVRYDRLSVKRSLEMGARTLAGYGMYEQGYGLIRVGDAFANLQRIDDVPALKARSPEGNGGLLARSYVPRSGTFLLTNLSDQLTRVNVTSSTSWIHAGVSNLTLPPGVNRELPFTVDPPATIGVNSGLIEVNNPARYGSSLTVPITYVRPLEMTGAPDRRYTTTASLGVSHYQRYFFNVAPGSKSLRATFRVLVNGQGAPQGTAQVQVFRPDGQAVHLAELGVGGTGLATLFDTVSPVEGVWEVVVTAIPDTTGAHLAATYTLDVTTQPGPIADQPLRFTVGAGTTTSVPLKLSNPFGAFTGSARAYGLTKVDGRNPWAPGVPWRVERKLENLIEDFTLPANAGVVRVELSNPVPSDTDVDLSLYYLDPIFGWQLVGQSVNRGIVPEAIELTNLPPGRYQSLAVVSGPTPLRLSYQYRRLVGVSGGGLEVVDSPRRHEIGESWTPTLTIKAPTAPGRYVGHILIVDSVTQQSLGWYPVELSVGQPSLSIEAMAPQLTTGRPGAVVLELRDTRNGQLVDGGVTVNGERYVSRGGRVVVPITAAGTAIPLDIDADLPAYQYLQKRINVSSAGAWQTFPPGVGSSEDSGAARRKIISQLP